MRAFTLTTLLVACAYFAAAEAALRLLNVSDDAAMVWFASGVGLSAFVLAGGRAATGVWLGAFLWALLGRAPLPAALTAVLTTAQIAVAWWLMRRVLDMRVGLERIRDMLALVLAGGVVVPLVSAARGFTAVWWSPGVATDERIGMILVASLGEAIGILLLVPVALAWTQHVNGAERRWPGREAWLLYGLTLVVSLAVFSGWLAPAMSAETLPYALFPLSFWAALRLGVRDTASVLLIAGAIAIGFHAMGMGPFVMPSIAPGHGFAQFGSLYLFLAVLSATSLLAAAAQHERETAEARARAHLDQLAHVARVASMGEMASAIAHEINQPLTAIANYANASLRLLKAGRLGPEETADTMRRLANEAERAGMVVRKMRGFVRGEEGRPRPVTVDELFADVLRLTSAEARQHDAEIVIVPDATLPPVLADTIQIEQVLINLTRNACEAMAAAASPERRVTLTARRTEDGMVEIAVRDTGPGLPASSQDKVFEPFYTTKPEGIGIGLALSRSIVDAHGGRLWAETGGPGAAFKLTLPVAEEAAHVPS